MWLKPLSWREQYCLMNTISHIKKKNIDSMTICKGTECLSQFIFCDYGNRKEKKSLLLRRNCLAHR